MFFLLAGFGFGLIYLPAIVSVTQWFEVRRSLATGIAVCGSGLGTVLFGFVAPLLVEEYNWNGALLIIAGIVFNCCIFGALFRPVEYVSCKMCPGKVFDGLCQNQKIIPISGIKSYTSYYDSP